MHRRIQALVATAAFLPALAFGATEEEEFRWTGSVASGATVAIHNMNGGIAAESGSGNEVEIVAVKEGPADHISEVEIAVIEHAGGLVICAMYPDDADDESTCSTDDVHLNNGTRNKTRVEFEIRLPSGVELDANTMNGRIRADGMRGNLRLTTMNGAINADSSGWINAVTMNGEIDVEMGSANWNGKLSLETMNGRVNVRLPADADTDVDAETMNGRVSSDWDSVDVRGRRRNRASGTIGSGGRDLELSSMNGSIDIRRGR